MQSLEEIGLAEYYFLDDDKIYNANRRQYSKPTGAYRYKLRTKEGIYKSITMKEIYRKLYNKCFCIDNIKLLKDEVFKEIEKTNGNYEVSNLGRIKSKMGNNAIILKPFITNERYEKVKLYVEDKKYNKFVHILVASAWLEKPKGLDYEVHHKDFNSLNNKATNLEYLNKIEHYKKHDEARKEQ